MDIVIMYYEKFGEKTTEAVRQFSDRWNFIRDEWDGREADELDPWELEEYEN